MEKTGSNKTNSGSSSSDKGNSARKIGRTGSHSPGSVSAENPAGGGGNRAGVSGNGVNPQQAHKRYLEGVLSKYTNLLQGWQNRYFVLDPELGQLQYFIHEQGRSHKPRGSLPLAGASVDQSDEAPHMFIVHATNGELYKLRATDAAEQLYWMSSLQACARPYPDIITKVKNLKGSEEHLCVEKTGSFQEVLCSTSSSSSGQARDLTLLPHAPQSSPTPGTQRHLAPLGPPGNIVTITHHKSPAAARRAKNQYPVRLLEVREIMTQAESQQKNLVHSIESLPTRGPLSCLDQDLLLIKATSTATLSCLGECLNILQQNVSQVTQHSHGRGPPSDGVPMWPRPRSPQEQLKNGRAPLASAEPSPALRRKGPAQSLEVSRRRTSAAVGPGPESGGEPASALRRKGPAQSVESQCPPVETVSHSEEGTDTEDNEEEDLGVMDDQRSVILHLLSQLKLGMDLTRVVLPTFILEKRSLLEMYANFMAHPDLFLAVTAASSPEERMVRFVEYYLTAFHEGRKGAVAKKPYNPVLGETFHCSWEVPRDRVRPPRDMAGPGCPDAYRVRFVAEQVSHHPPVSGFYCECRERGMCVNAHIWTKSKFMGMSVGVSMVGEGVLCLLEHDEEYVFTLPSAYARSILTVPWVELGGKVSINCAKSGYSASVTFHTKPFYGGKVHRVTAEVKHNATNTIVCKAQGEWNGTLEFTYSSGETKVIDTAKLPVIKKRIRPVEKQGHLESRRLWQHVTTALKEEDMEAATKHKHRLEERQRGEERQRAAAAAAAAPWSPKYFLKEGDSWVFYNPLWKTH